MQFWMFWDWNNEFGPRKFLFNDDKISKRKISLSHTFIFSCSPKYPLLTATFALSLLLYKHSTNAHQLIPKIYMYLVLRADGPFWMKNFYWSALFLFILKLMCCLSQTVDVCLVVFTSHTEQLSPPPPQKGGRQNF